MITDHPNWPVLDTWTRETIEHIKNRQNAYFSKNKKFFQGLKTPAGRPDGEQLLDVAYGLRPSDQADSWHDFAPEVFKAGVQFPAAVRIDVHQSVSGWGYTIRFELWRAGLGPDAYGSDGDHWVFRHNEGLRPFDGIWGEWFIEVESPGE